MIVENVNLNGYEDGIIVEVVKDHGNNTFINSKDNYVRKFKNLKIAKMTNKSIVGKLAKLKYYFVIGDKQFPLSYAQKVKDHWEIIDNEVKYIIKENKNYTITSIGYLVFDNGDIIKRDKEEGYKRKKELFNCIKYAASYVLYNNEEVTINKIFIRKNELILSVKNSTAKIHICSNSRIMDLNQERKENNYRCITFRKDMDKYTTFHVFVTKDQAETERMGSRDNTEIPLNQLINSIQDTYPDAEFKYEPVEFTGYILYMEE